MAAPRKTTRTTARPATRTAVATKLGFGPVVEATLQATPLEAGDAAAAHLARALAAAIDRGRTVADRDDALDRHGPKLLAVLRELGATPTSRRRLVPGGRPAGTVDDEPPTPSEVDQTPGLTALRAAHGRRGA